MARPVDLDAERRRRGLLDELAALLADPALAERTRDNLAGPAAWLSLALEAPLDKPKTVRLPLEVLDRLDALAERMSAVPTLAALAGGRLSDSAVLRIAVIRGLDLLEAEYPARVEG